jgi:hypothetical protein
VTATVQAQADNPQDAATVAALIQLLVNLAQTQSSTNPSAAELASGVTVKTSGATITLTLSLPEDEFQQLLAPNSNLSKRRAERRM